MEVALKAKMKQAALVAVVAAASLACTNAFLPTPAVMGGATPALRKLEACSLRRPTARSGLVLKMGDVETKKKQGSPVSVVSKQSTEPNLCDINDQLCDGEVHTLMEAPKGAAGSVEAKEPATEQKQSMMSKVKDAGIAGIISYALWEFAFWTICAPAAVIAYHQTTGEWPSFDNPESTAKVSALIFGFLNVARALVPVRIGLTLATAPLVDKYIVQPFKLKKD